MDKMFFGEYGGCFVPENLQGLLEDLGQHHDKYKNDSDFLNEYRYYLDSYGGRPTPVTYLDKISSELGGAKIYVKREDLTTVGAHKINHSVYQALLAKKMGKKKLVAETGAGMHGTSVAMVGAKFGFEVRIFMGAKDYERQKDNVKRMEIFGAEVVPVYRGTQTLTDAVSEAIEYFASNYEDSHYLLGSAVGPYPYPEIVRRAQSVVGNECLEQFPVISGKQNPDYVLACVGGGSNAIGIFSAYIDDSRVNLVGVEAGGKDVDKVGDHAARIKGKGGAEDVFHGYKSVFIKSEDGEIATTHSISAGLDYVGIGPEHAYLHSQERVNYEYVYDEKVIQAFEYTARKEGLLPALESCHALAYAYELAPDLSSQQAILVNLSGRGDKDLEIVREYRNS